MFESFSKFRVWGAFLASVICIVNAMTWLTMASIPGLVVWIFAALVFGIAGYLNSQI